MKILIATDGSDYSKAAIEKACELARPADDSILLLSCYEDPVPVGIDPAILSSDYYQHVTDAVREAAENHIRQAEDQIRRHFAAGNITIAAEVGNGFAENLIIEKAKEWGADLIVVGSHGRGFWGRLLGSVSNGVVHHAPCSVLVVRGRDDRG